MLCHLSLSHVERGQHSVDKCRTTSIFTRSHVLHRVQRCRGRLRSVEVGGAGDISVVVLLLRNDGQDGLNLPVAQMCFFVDNIRHICSGPAPCEFRWVVGAGVFDGTGDSVGTSLIGRL